MYKYRTRNGVEVTSSVPPNPPSRWDSMLWHAPLSWSLWARNIGRQYRYSWRKRWAR